MFPLICPWLIQVVLHNSALFSMAIIFDHPCLIRKGIITSLSPNPLPSSLRYSTYLHLSKISLGWGKEGGKASQTVPGDPTWTQEMPRMEVEGVTSEWTRNRPHIYQLLNFLPWRQLRVGRAYSKQRSKAKPTEEELRKIAEGGILILWKQLLSQL